FTVLRCSSCFLFPAPPPSEIYTLSLHDALPIFELLQLAADDLEGHEVVALEPQDVPEPCQVLLVELPVPGRGPLRLDQALRLQRSEEHTSELQSRGHLVCRLLLEKKNNKTNNPL